MKTAIYDKAIVFIVGAFVALLWMNFQNCNRNAPVSAENVVKRDRTVDLYGREIIRLRVERQAAAAAVNNRDSVIRAMSNAKTEAVVRVETKTVERVVVKTEVVSVGDTVKAYTGKWNDRWSVGDVWVNKDSIKATFYVFNQLGISVEKRRRLWKPDEAVVTVMNYNPHTVSVNESAFVVKERPKRWWMWLLSGVVVGSFVASVAR